MKPYTLFLFLIFIVTNCFSQLKELPEQPTIGKCYMKTTTKDVYESYFETYPIYMDSMIMDIEFDTIQLLMQPKREGFAYRQDVEPCNEYFKDCVELIPHEYPEVWKKIVFLKSPNDSMKFEMQTFEGKYLKEIGGEIYWLEVDCEKLGYKELAIDFLDDFFISDWGKTDIDKFIIPLLDEFPDHSIEIRSHLERIGDWQKNIEVSENRIAAIKHYLIEKGFSENRILGIGYGDLLEKGDLIEFRLLN